MFLSPKCSFIFFIISSPKYPFYYYLTLLEQFFHLPSSSSHSHYSILFISLQTPFFFFLTSLTLISSHRVRDILSSYHFLYSTNSSPTLFSPFTNISSQRTNAIHQLPNTHQQLTNTLHHHSQRPSPTHPPHTNIPSHLTNSPSHLTSTSRVPSFLVLIKTDVAI